jgi:hypothetical protein
MLLIYSNREAYAALSAEAQAQVNQDYFTYTQRIQDSGEYVAGDPLQGVDTATTVRRKDGQRTLTDGPYLQGGGHAEDGWIAAFDKLATHVAG